MFNLVHTPGAPNNAFEFKVRLYKYVGIVGLDFIFPKHLDKAALSEGSSWKPEADFGDGKPVPWPIGKLEIDYDDAIKLRDALSEAIEELETHPHKKDWIRHNGRSES